MGLRTWRTFLSILSHLWYKVIVLMGHCRRGLRQSCLTQRHLSGGFGRLGRGDGKGGGLGAEAVTKPGDMGGRGVKLAFGGRD